MENIKKELEKNIKLLKKEDKKLANEEEGKRCCNAYGMTADAYYIHCDNIEKIVLKRKYIINNILYLFQNLIINDPDIKKIHANYKNKRIGEKTKEKIQNEVTALLKDKTGITTRFYIDNDYHWLDNTISKYEYSFYIDICNNYYNSLKFKIHDYIKDMQLAEKDGKLQEYIKELQSYGWTFWKDLENKDHKLSIENHIKNYVDVKDITRQASTFLKKQKTAKEKIDKLLKTAKDIQKNFDSLCEGETMENYRLYNTYKLY